VSSLKAAQLSIVECMQISNSNILNGTSIFLNSFYWLYHRNGVLAISRAFGDISFKYEGPSSAYGTGPVSCVPDIVSEVITPMTEFAIIASDGLFDVVSYQEAVNFVRKRLAKKVDLSVISKELTDEAIKEGSIDNITVLLISFHTSFK
jgi:serine/threonine protein phosphatase PrpC